MGPPGNPAELDKQAVRSVPLFAALGDEADELLGRFQTIRRPAGTILFTPTDRAERLFAVRAGRVKLYKLSATGNEQILHLYGPGHSFAEAAVLAGGMYPAFAKALDDVTLLVVTRRELRQAIADNPDLAMGMLAGLSAKLHEFNRLIEELSLKDAPARLAGVLLRLAERAGGATVYLQQTRRELAGQIGTAAETLSRALGKLKDAGLIEVRGRRITLLDADALAELARPG